MRRTGRIVLFGITLISGVWACGSAPEEVAENTVVPETRTESVQPVSEKEPDTRTKREPEQVPQPQVVLEVPQTTLQVDAAVQPASAVGTVAVTEPGTIHPVALAFHQLVDAYRTGQPAKWTTAEQTLHAHGATALPILAGFLADEDRQVRELSSMMISQILPHILFPESGIGQLPTNDVLISLRKALADQSPEVRVNVAVALSLMESEAQPIIPVLIELSRAPLPHVRTMAVAALGGLVSHAAVITPQLTHIATNDSDESVRTAAAQALEMLRLN